jgi:hypothetical protein
MVIQAIERSRVKAEVLTAATTEGDATIYDNSKAGLLMAKASGSATITVYAGLSTEGETFLPLLGEDGEAIEFAATATDWIVIPADVYAAPLLKFVGSAAVTLTVAGTG